MSLDPKIVRKIRARKRRISKIAKEKSELEISGNYCDRDIETKNLHKCEDTSEKLSNLITVIDDKDEEVFNIALDLIEKVDHFFGLENEKKEAIECFYDICMHLGMLDLATKEKLGEKFSMLKDHLMEKCKW